MYTGNARCICATLALLGLGSAANAQDLLTYDNGTNIAGHDVSGDGSVVVGKWDSQAMRWTEATGPVQIDGQEAHGISADGTTIVGFEIMPNGDDRAFRSTQAGGFELLDNTWADGSGILEESIAYDVSGDGSVIVGRGFDWTTVEGRAIYWTPQGVKSLGVFNGGNSSFAYAVSADGKTIVGSSNSSSPGQTAFSWTEQSGLVSLGRLNNGTVSEARGVSDDGSVIVGQAADGAALQSLRAVRWVNGGAIESLGGLFTGGSSQAHAVSGNGLVIVGAANELSGFALRAMRHTDADGMETVEDWLRRNGVTIPSNITQMAHGVSEDGSVIVGEAYDNRMFIARGPAATGGGNDSGGGGNEGGGDQGGGGNQGNGIVTLEDVAESLTGTSAAVGSALSNLDTLLNGAGSRPLDRRVDPGRSTMWMTGDLGLFDAGLWDGGLGLAEIGFGHNTGPVQINASFGLGRSGTNTTLGGNTRIGTVSAKIEAASRLVPTRDGGLWGVVTGTGVFGRADISRNYLANAGAVVTSSGETDLAGYGVRARLQWENAVPHVSPYGELSWSEACLGSYTETGGPFPAAFNRRCQSKALLRYGADATVPVSDRLRLIGTLEGVLNVGGSTAPGSGQLVGLQTFSVPGAGNRNAWVRGGVGFETNVTERAVFSLMANGTAGGGTTSAWLSAHLRSVF